MGPLLRNLAKVDPYTEMLVDCLKTIKMRDPIPKFYKGPKNRDPFTEKGFPYKFFGTPSTKYVFTPKKWDLFKEIGLKHGPSWRSRDPFSEIKNARDPYNESKPM